MVSSVNGTKIGNYRLVKSGELPHLQGQYLELLHEPTGARHVHIACPDDNKAFAVAFPTVPQDSTGVAHILEHIVLCGSERFPVRDPFFSMIPRSLSTFMNAFTSADFTCYPFSTRNEKDFYNLLEVYLDATFFPQIEYQAYRQEAWRYQFAELENPHSPLKYEGVVFNEMKGARSTPSSLMYRAIGQAIFPDLTYAHDSGGDPQFIPDLTWEALKEFHARHYHPSNSYFFTYGNLPLQKTLESIERLVLSRFAQAPVHLDIPDQPRFSDPIRFEAVYPLSPAEHPDKKSQVLLAWLTAKSADSTEMLALRVLERVLLSNAASPLRKALLESQIGEALADGTGLEDSYREAVFAAGLKGVNPQDAEKIEVITLGVLEDLAQRGLDPAMVDAALHRLEIESREVSNVGYPYGLKVFFQLSSAYLKGGVPYHALQFDADLAKLQEERAKGPYLENLIRRYFLENPHRATIVLKPDQQLTERREAEERAKLDRIRQTLSDQAVQEIIAEAKALKARQETPEDTSVLPTLELSDIPMTLEDVPHTLQEIAGVSVGLFPQPTNGISYLDLQFDLASLPDPLKDLLPLFAFAVTKMGGGKSDYLEMAERIEAYTGGVSAVVGQRSQPDNLEGFRASLTLSGKALYRNHLEFFAILRDLLTDLKWDKANLKNLLGQLKASFEARVVQAGHLFSWYLAEAQFGGKHLLQERWEGLSQTATLKRLAALDEAGLEGLLADLETIRRHLFQNANLRVCVTSEESQLEPLERMVGDLLAGLPTGQGSQSPQAAAPRPSLEPQARTTAVPVAYDAKVWRTVPFEHPDAPALLALANLLRSEYLHKEIREKGGAYGGFAVCRFENGVFAMLSYRDPHVARTFKVYQDALNFLQSPLEPEKLKEAILAAAGDVDPLLSPDNKGRTRFFSDLAGFTLDKKLEFKKRLLEVRLEDLRRVAQRYLTQEAALAVIGSPEKIEEANRQMGNVFSVKAI
ncbi:MAG TPA: insulinase family protein [Meiothermus sp.]|nr:insulinase family protein [Meiothermus sp.]